MLPPAGLLVQRLVVPEPDRGDVDQLGGGLSEAGVEREWPDVGTVLPQVHALDERLLVARALVEGPVVAGGAGAHPSSHRRAVAIDLLVGEQAGDHDEAVAPERLDHVVAQQLVALRIGHGHRIVSITSISGAVVLRLRPSHTESIQILLACQRHLSRCPK